MLVQWILAGGQQRKANLHRGRSFHHCQAEPLTVCSAESLLMDTVNGCLVLTTAGFLPADRFDC